jgi:hypothetical protein
MVEAMSTETPQRPPAISFDVWEAARISALPLGVPHTLADGSVVLPVDEITPGCLGCVGEKPDSQEPLEGLRHSGICSDLPDCGVQVGSGQKPVIFIRLEDVPAYVVARLSA